MRYTLAHKVKLGINPFIYFSMGIVAYVFYVTPTNKHLTQNQTPTNQAQKINEKIDSKIFITINEKNEYRVNNQLIDSVKLGYELEKVVFHLNEDQKNVILHVQKSTKASQIAYVATKVQQVKAQLKLNVE